MQNVYELEVEPAFLERIKSPYKLPSYLASIIFAFDLGQPEKIEVIKSGYQDLNLKLFTSQGKFVIKIFKKQRTQEDVRRVVNLFVEFYKNGISVPKLHKTRYGEYLFSSDGEVFACVMDFFEGEDFMEQKITYEDIQIISENLAKINKLDFPTAHIYDPWSAENLKKEFALKSSALDDKIKDLIKPIVNNISEELFASLQQGIIHGDLYRRHVLKSNSNYCILDLDLARRGAVALDLAIFLATFVFNNELKDEELIHQLEFAIASYQTINPLLPHDRQQIIPLMFATYAAFLIGLHYEINVNNDNSKQTLDWNTLVLSNLSRLQKLNFAIS